MKNKVWMPLVVLVVLLSLSWIARSQEPKNNMTFFITSVGSGKGADLGGLAGADKHCQSLAPAAGAGKPHLARLPQHEAGSPAVNARDRIGKGPWHNAKGVLIARDVKELHSNNNKINKENALSEKGETINARGDKPNMHDILTGSQPDGRAFTGSEDMTCRNWTSGTTGTAMLATTTAKDLRTTKLLGHGTNPIPPAAPVAAADAARKVYAARAATVCFTASR